jgi:hypothetical protein
VDVGWLWDCWGVRERWVWCVWGRCGCGCGWVSVYVGVRGVYVYGVWCVHVVCGVWCMVCGVWGVVCGVGVCVWVLGGWGRSPPALEHSKVCTCCDFEHLQRGCSTGSKGPGLIPNNFNVIFKKSTPAPPDSELRSNMPR